MQPLVVTLAIDDEHQARFDAERARLFPAGRTAVGAHVTLFHALPGDLVAEVAAALAEQGDRRSPFPVDVDTVVPLGSGVAYRVRSAELAAVHAELRSQFRSALTAQDAQGFRPHVTVQNKVSHEVARRTLVELQSGFSPFRVEAVGLQLWRYLGGPWEPVQQYRFDAGYR